MDEAFRRLLAEPEAMEHVRRFAERDVASVLTREGLEARRQAEVATALAMCMHQHA